MSRVRLAPQDWTRAALRALAEGGVGAVRVDALARDLGVTRGSFYWHFADRDALLKAALEQWERSTAGIIGDLGDVGDPAERLVRLVRGAFGGESVPGLQPALMAHADHPVVMPVLRRVTAQRVDYISAIYRELRLAPDAARRRAVIGYATYLGWLDLRRGPDDIVPEVTPGQASPAVIDDIVAMFLADVPATR
ncbi:TetR/AcrR family transcriptional regulator [Actinomadura darangshiensis]|uniref:TetR/AcrR family transcriptional regulator n=1 Tax=Actinomadura darangshiensis TaxID=705336 RepID=A0A4R5A4G1_9ACTN|nr:TetR/AcrR family transcriptional regulator [Actinomadura darangshiensis]TDD66868.1 TetR/AcrR family transcriptional regulator [Actinomadura darangshiensis]